MHGFFEAGFAIGHIEEHWNSGGFEAWTVNAAQLLELFIGQNGRIEMDLPATFGFGNQQIALWTNGRISRGDDLFFEGIERGIGHLGKELFEVVVEQMWFVGQYRQGRVVAH